MKGFLMSKLWSKMPIFARIMILLIVLVLFAIFLIGCSKTVDNEPVLIGIDDAKTIQYSDLGNWQVVYHDDFSYYEVISVKKDYFLILIYDENKMIIDYLYTPEYYVVERGQT